MRPLFICQAAGFTITSSFYSLLISATVTDNSGDTADTLELAFDDRNNVVAAPPEGTQLTPLFGYQETGVTSMGVFTVTRIKPSMGEEGETLTILAEAADFRQELKERQTENFDDTTLGDMLKEVFGRHGMQIEVDSELASIEIEYEARVNQSAVEFAMRQAQKYGAVAKPGGGKYVFAKKGKAASVSGQPLAPILIHKSDCEGAEFDIKPRPRHGRVAAKWFDRAEGKIKFETVSTGAQGPLKSLPHTFRNAEEAKAAAQSAGTDANRKTGSGSFTFAGRPTARAEADVIATGFRPETNGKWRAETVTHEFGEDGYLTTVQVKAPEEQKKGGS